MKKILKKSLALTVALCCCLAAMLGCFIVSAENEPTAKIVSAQAAPGETIDLSVQFTNLDNGVCAALNAVTFPEGFVINSARNADENSDFIIRVFDEENGGNVAIEGTTLKFLEFFNFPEEISMASLTMLVNVTVPETAGTYDVTLSVDAASYEELPTAVTIENGTVTVANAHEHAYTEEITQEATCTEAGVKTLTCTCGDTKTEEIPALGHAVGEPAEENRTEPTCNTPGSYDSVVRCTRCNEIISSTTVEIAATGEHTAAEAVVENKTNATCTTDGSYDSVVYCKDCGTEISRTTVTDPATGHSWGELQYALVNGKCVTKHTCTACNTEEVIAEIANPKLGHAPVYGDDLTLIFRIDNTAIDGYTDVKAVLTKDLFEGTVTEDGFAPDVTSVLPVVYSSTRKQFVYSGIRAKEMSSNINIQVFGTDASGNVILLAIEDYSMVDYIKTAYNARKNAAANTKNAAERQLVVDMANYGAAAQIHFNYNTDNLANADIPQDYATPTITNFEGELVQSAAVFGRAPDYKNKVLINVRFNKTVNGKAVTKAVIDYTNTQGETLSMTADLADFTNYSSTRYQIVYDKMTAATMSSPFTVTVYDAEGNSLAYFTYSMEIYAKQATAASSTSEAEKTLINRLIAYGRSAKAYLTF